MRCKGCHYSLENLTELRCPECGRAFDLNDPDTWELEVMAVRRVVGRIVVVAFILMLLFFVAMLVPVITSYPIF